MNYRHGEAGSIEYSIWGGMKDRCYNRSIPGYLKYGGRGIVVCDRWLNSFENFLSDMGRRPSPNHSLDRINNNGDYTPDNCRWATPKEQANNRRNSLLYTLDGETMTLKQWCERLGLKYKTIWARINAYGFTFEAAISDKR